MPYALSASAAADSMNMDRSDYPVSTALWQEFSDMDDDEEGEDDDEDDEEDAGVHLPLPSAISRSAADALRDVQHHMLPLRCRRIGACRGR